MTTTDLPPIGELVTSKKEEGDLALTSVTTVLGILDKPALIHWTANTVAERAVGRLALIQRRLEDEGPEAAAKYVAGLRWERTGLSDSQMGTLAHAMFDVYAITGERPKVVPELHPDFKVKGELLTAEDMHTLRRLIDQFDRFLGAFAPEYEATEVVVYHPLWGYAGQCDGFMTIAGTRLIADYKTSRQGWDKRGQPKGPYPEVGLQLAAYRYAAAAAVWRARKYESYSRRYYLLSSAELEAAKPVPEVDQGVAIYITPERFDVYPVKCGEHEWAVFQRLINVAGWVFNEADQVVGNPWPAPFGLPPDAGDPFAGLPTD